MYNIHNNTPVNAKFRLHFRYAISILKTISFFFVTIIVLFEVYIKRESIFSIASLLSYKLKIKYLP